MQAVSWRPEIIEPQTRWGELIIFVLVRGSGLRDSPDLPRVTRPEVAELGLSPVFPAPQPRFFLLPLSSYSLHVSRISLLQTFRLCLPLAQACACVAHRCSCLAFIKSAMCGGG